MSIDLTENLLTLAEASKRLPSRPNVCTLWRWANRGARGRKLETVLVGGRRYTSLEALNRFVAESPTKETALPREAKESAAKRKRRAEAFCEREGL